MIPNRLGQAVILSASSVLLLFLVILLLVLLALTFVVNTALMKLQRP